MRGFRQIGNLPEIGVNVWKLEGIFIWDFSSMAITLVVGFIWLGIHLTGHKSWGLHSPMSRVVTPVTYIFWPFTGVITPFRTGKGPSCRDQLTFFV